MALLGRGGFASTRIARNPLAVFMPARAQWGLSHAEDLSAGRRALPNVDYLRSLPPVTGPARSTTISSQGSLSRSDQSGVVAAIDARVRGHMGFISWNSLASCAAHFSASNCSTTLRCPAKPISPAPPAKMPTGRGPRPARPRFPGDQKPRHTVFDQLRHSRYTGGDDGAAGRHRFHEHHRHTFGKARQAEHVGLCVVAAYVVLTDRSFERDPVCYAEVLGATPKPFPERAVPDQDKPRLGSPVNDHLHRAQQNFQSLGGASLATQSTTKPGPFRGGASR